MLRRFITTIFLLYAIPGYSQQDRIEELAVRLESYAMEYPRIDRQIDISITGTIQEFALAFSKETKISLTADPAIRQSVAAHFSETRPRDILLFLCRTYDLDLAFSGAIVSLVPFHKPEPPPEKTLNIRYNPYTQKLELNLKSDTLDSVLETISRLTGQNIIAAKQAGQETVRGYVGATGLEEALEQMARRNDLRITKAENGYYLVDKTIPGPGDAEMTGSAPVPNTRSPRTRPGNAGGKKKLRNSLETELITDSLGTSLLRIRAEDVPAGDIIREAAENAGQSYFICREPGERVTLDLEGVTYEQLLAQLCTGNSMGYKLQDGVWLIGEPLQEGLRETKLRQLQHRSVQDVTTLIPKELTEGLQIQEFSELNALILSGSAAGIREVLAFIEEIDQPVPVVMIELLIVDFQDQKEVRLGLETGITDQEVVTGGRIFPGTDFTFSTQSINRLLDLLAGNGIVNLGRVPTGFYASLQAIENNGFAKVVSKPRLSTLNGREANLSIGETRYYINERTTLQGNQAPVTLQDRRFEAVNADFSIRILPVISGDEYITLEIEVSQSDFIGQIQNNAPPPQVNRSFTSNIRILDREMIVLGGLESNSVENSGTGVPWLSRIPVLKWFFSSRRKAKGKTQLLLFVRPRVLY